MSYLTDKDNIMCESKTTKKKRVKRDVFASAVDWVFSCRMKYGNKFDYSNVEFSKRATKVKIVCPIHGEFEQSPSTHLHNACGCPDCGAQKTLIINKAKNNILLSEKECNKCGIVKPIDGFPVYKRKRKHGYTLRVHSSCLDCKREMDRTNVKRYDQRKNAKACAKYQEKLRRDRLTNQLNDNMSSFVFFKKCKACGKCETKRKEPKGKYASYCLDCFRVYNMLGRTFDYVELKCVDCGILFNGKPGTKRCSTCARKRKKEIQKKNRKPGNIRRRCKQHGVHYEHVNKKKVFERDKYKCKLCGCKVQKKDIYADNAAEVDHIIPISLGGAHTYSNVQTSCRKCNIAKSNSDVEGEQITIFSKV